MFTNILFLILALLLINTIPEKISPWITSDLLAFGVSLLLYFLLCVCIFLIQFVLNGMLKKRPGFVQIFVHILLLVYLIIYQYLLDAGRIFRSIPYMHNVQSLNAVWELFLYLGGLWIYYMTSYRRHYSYGELKAASIYAWRQLRLILPFTLPFLFMTLALDIFDGIATHYQINLTLIEVISATFSLALVIVLLIFLPYFIQKIWGCTPLPEGEFKDRLAKICNKANFKHAGLKIWTMMYDQLTAGIIGIVPRFRYVMFTDRLIRDFSPEWVEAILAHEIGHNKHKHLLIYPFILSGMIICAGLIYYYFSDNLLNFLEQQNAVHPSIWWDFFNPLLIFSLYAGIIIIYFRFVFGYFSRLFERQADLYVFDLGIDPKYMVEALKAVAHTSGGYDTPNWHHFSIKQRIDFLILCTAHPDLIKEHHKKVKRALGVYFLLWIVFFSLLIYKTLHA